MIPDGFIIQASLLLAAFGSTTYALTFAKYLAVNETKVEGNWQSIRNVDKYYKCCIACEEDTECMAINHNKDTETCELMHVDEHDTFALTAASGWTSYFTDLKDVNLLSNAVTTQSTTCKPPVCGMDAVAELAIDGITNGYWSGGPGGSCAHTTDTGDAWWMVDFQRDFSISAVILWNRIETLFFHRLQGLTLRVANSVTSLNDESSVCGYYPGPPASPFDNPIGVNCTRVMYGRFLKIELEPNINGLTLCEVQVIQ